MDAPWCHFLTVGAWLHLRRGSSCCPGGEDGEEPAEQETSDSPGLGMTPGVCHPRLGRGGEGTWAWIRRGGAEGRGCHQGQRWGGWVQPSITPVSLTGSGKGTSRFLVLSHLGWEAGTGMGSAGTEDMEQGIKPSQCWRPSPCSLCCSLCLAFPKFITSHHRLGWGGSMAGACTASPSQRNGERDSIP